MENKRVFIFKTPRLGVRAFTPEDWARLSEIGGNPKVARMMMSLNAPWPEADHFADNPVSGRVLHEQGFEKIGEGTGKSAARLEPAPNVLYRLTKQQFKAAKHEIS